MNHLEFSKYHNRHIRFMLKDKWYTGVVLDLIPFNKKKNNSDYVFVSTENLLNWKSSGAEDRIKFQRVIDIRFIQKVSHFKPENDGKSAV